MSENLKKSIAEWIETQISRYPYGECQVRVIMHAGRVVCVERLVLEKMREAQ